MFGNYTTNYCHKQQNNCIKVYEKQVYKAHHFMISVSYS